MDGWIKLHRALLKWEWYTTPNMVHFWIHCLLLANHSDMSWRGKIIKKGQFVSGRKSLSANTGLSEQQIRTCIERLKSTNELTSETTNEYSIFTIISWEKYQIEESSNQQLNQPSTSEQPTINQPSTTNNNDKNGNNGKNEKKIHTKAFVPPTLEEAKAFCKEKGYSLFDSAAYIKHRTDCNWIKSNDKMVKDWKRDIVTSNSFGNFQRKLTQEELENEAMLRLAAECAKDVGVEQ